MARTRLIKPDFFHDETLAELPFEARLLLAGLWLIADREGRLEDRPRRIRASVFPYEPTVDAEALLQMLAASGFVSRYTVNDESYIQIVNFSKQQQPHYRETPSEIPPQTGHANSLLGVGRVSPAQRVRVLDRDGHKCLRCGATERLHIDHVRPGSLGGDSVDDNLQTLCASCNTSKGNRSSADYRPTLSQPRTDVAPTSANDGALCPPVSVSVSVFDTDTVRDPVRVSRFGGSVLSGSLHRDHLSHAACSPNFAWCVPEAVHVKLASKLAPKHGGDVAASKDALVAWYPTVWATLPEGTVLGDAWKFWTPRFDAAFASMVPVAPPSRPRGCKHDPVCASDAAHTSRYMRELHAEGA